MSIDYDLLKTKIKGDFELFKEMVRETVKSMIQEIKEQYPEADEKEIEDDVKQMIFNDIMGDDK